MDSEKQFQFTPLREGRQLSYNLLIRVWCISIHAPPRGATLISSAITSVNIFQFTPLREGRQT